MIIVTVPLSLSYIAFAITFLSLRLKMCLSVGRCERKSAPVKGDSVCEVRMCSAVVNAKLIVRSVLLM